MINGRTELLVRAGSLAASVMSTSRWFATQAPQQLPWVLAAMALAAVVGANNL